MRRVLFLNRFFYPDHSATGQILTDLALHLSTDHDVHVVTGQSLYDDPATRLPAHETVRGVTIHRVKTTQFGRQALPGRAVDYVSFYAAMWRRVLALARRDDIIVAKTDPPLLSIPAWQAAKRRGARLVNWLHDLYPEIAIELGVPLLKGPIGFALASMRDRSLRAADANVVIGERMAARLQANGIARVHVIPNWTDDEAITPLPSNDNPLRVQWNLRDRFVVGYSGNLGRAHEFETILAAAEHLRNYSSIVFVFIGAGQQFEDLRHRIRELRFEDRFRFLPYQDRDQLKFSLSVPDVHWISLKPALEGLIFPSKFYGIAAAGRPIIAVAATDGELARLVQAHQCGYTVVPGDSSVLAERIMELSSRPELCASMGANARAMLEANFSRRQAFARWRSVLAEL